MKEMKYQKTDEYSDRLTLELLDRIGYDPDDYFAVAAKITPDILKWYIDLAITVGIEHGIKQNVRHGMKKVVAFNGVSELPFDSIRDGARFFHTNHANIVRSINQEQRCKKYYWRYA